MKHRLLLPFLALSLACLTGCATKIDWSGRVGTYSYDDAVRELGPPDKHAELTDGTVVADWITRRGGPHVHGGFWHYGPRYGRMSWDTHVVNLPDWIIRLEFDPDGKLVRQQRVAR